MHNSRKVFCDYLEAVIQDVPWWGYAIAIVILIIGSVIAFVKKGRNEGLRMSACLFLLLYVMVLYCSTVFFRTTTTTTHYPFEFFWHYKDFVHGQWLWLPEVIMNIAVFVPVGFVLGLAFRKIKGWQVVLVGMGFSVGIELLQYFFKKGFADVDDVMNNTLGCALGWLVYWMMRQILHNSKNRKIEPNLT